MFSRWLVITAAALTASANQDTAAVAGGTVTVGPTSEVKGQLQAELMLNCGDGKSSGLVRYWHTPFGDLQRPGFVDPGPVLMRSDGTLVVSNCSRRHSGLYYCLLQDARGTTLWPYRVHVHPDHGGLEEVRVASWSRRGVRSDDGDGGVSQQDLAAAVAVTVLLTFVVGFSAGALSRTYVLRCLGAMRTRMRSPRQQSDQTDHSGVTMTTLPPWCGHQEAEPVDGDETMETTVSSITSFPPIKPQRSFRLNGDTKEESSVYLEGCGHVREEETTRYLEGCGHLKGEEEGLEEENQEEEGRYGGLYLSREDEEEEKEGHEEEEERRREERETQRRQEEERGDEEEEEEEEERRKKEDTQRRQEEERGDEEEEEEEERRKKEDTQRRQEEERGDEEEEERRREERETQRRQEEERGEEEEKEEEEEERRKKEKETQRRQKEEKGDKEEEEEERRREEETQMRQEEEKGDKEEEEERRKEKEAQRKQEEVKGDEKEEDDKEEMRPEEKQTQRRSQEEGRPFRGLFLLGGDEEEETKRTQEEKEGDKEEEEERRRQEQEEEVQCPHSEVSTEGGDTKPEAAPESRRRRSRIIRLYQYDEEGQRYRHLPDPAPDEPGPAPRLRQRSVSLTRLNAIMAAAWAGPLDSEGDAGRREETHFHMDI